MYTPIGMRVGLFDAIRIQSLELIFNKKQKFYEAWDQKYSDKILSHLLPDDKLGFRSRLISLGSNLHKIFRADSKDARGSGDVSEAQSKMSVGGTAWERIVVWYLNALGSGLNAVIFNKKGQSTCLPKSFRDAFNVKISNTSISSDLDVAALNWIGPDDQDWMLERFESTAKEDMARAKKIF